jgi:hypothetical protein
MHRSRRNHPDQSAFVAKRESHMKQPPVVGSTQGMQSQFMDGVPNILDDQQRIIEENLFRFTLANRMLFSALAAISLIPIETLDL